MLEGRAADCCAKENNLMKTIVCTLLCLVGSTAAAEHRCASDARARAEKLLAFHMDDDSRLDIDDVTKTLAPLRNPSDVKQKFDVIEVTGYVYKATYRMRLIYAQLPGECVLVGQEILEMTSL